MPGRKSSGAATGPSSKKRKLSFEPTKLISTDFHLYNGHEVTWADVHGAERVQNEVCDFFSALRHPKRWKKVARPRRTLLLTGPPGTGKTSAVRAIVHETMGLQLQTPVTFFKVMGSDVFGGDWSNTARTFRELIDSAVKKAPSIIFLDECDVVFRGDGRLVGELKDILTGIEAAPNNILLIGATNHVEKIDAAIMSRLGDPIELPLPLPETRRKIIEATLSEHPFELSESEWAQVLNATEGRDGRWLAEKVLCPEVARIVARVESPSLARYDPRTINFADFQKVLSRHAAVGTSAAGCAVASLSAVPPSTQMCTALVPSTSAAVISDTPAAEPSGREMRVAAARRLFSLADGSPIKFRHEVYAHLAEHEPDAWASFGSECKRKEAITRPTRGKVTHPLIVGEWNWVLHDAFGFKAFTHDVGRNQHDPSLPSGFYTTQLAFK